MILSRVWGDWRSTLAIVKPETVIGWHRQGFRLFWTGKVRRGKPGRPAVSREVRDLIHESAGRIPSGAVSVGINRRGAVNERVIQERRSEPSWPRAMRGQL